MSAQSLLPPNATRTERAFEAAIAAHLDAVPTPHRDVWNPDDCPSELLPYLAWSLGVQTWDADWREEIRRARVRMAIPIARRRGTRAAVREVIESFGGSMVLREWWETDPHGSRHTFDLVLTLSGGQGEPASAGFVEAVIAEVERVKPARAHFTFSQALYAASNVYLVAGARVTLFARSEVLAK